MFEANKQTNEGLTREEEINVEELTKGIAQSSNPAQALRNATDNLGLKPDASNKQIGGAMNKRDIRKTK